MQGFITAVANPKGWAFFIALLPPFINKSAPLAPQLAVLVAIILLLETLCLLIYAGGGRTLSRLLQRGENVRLMNRIAGTLMLLVGAWLAFG
jgi:threonine/homoserine/homoserine lactone efflux protein